MHSSKDLEKDEREAMENSRLKVSRHPNRVVSEGVRRWRELHGPIGVQLLVRVTEIA